MKFLHIDPTNNKKKSKNMLTDELNNNINSGKNVFMLVYMEHCGPCEQTRPEWGKIRNVLETKYANNDNILVVDINKDLIQNIKCIKEYQIKGFPTIKYISKQGKFQEDFEDSNVKNKDRTIDAFVEWINSKNKEYVGGRKRYIRTRKNKSKRTKSRRTKTRKNTSRKYK